MKKTISAFFLFAALVVLTFSCRKGDFAAEHYQAGITVNASELTTARLEVRFDGAATGDSLVAGGTVKKIFDLSGPSIGQGLSRHFSVYKAGTDTLVADTSVLLHKGDLAKYNVIYSDELGLGGFVDLSDVPGDSIRLRIIYHDGTAAKKFAKLEWQFYELLQSGEYPYYDSTESVKIILSLNEGQYSPDFHIPKYRNDGVSPVHPYTRLRVPGTEDFLFWYPDFAIFEPNMDANDLGAGNYYFYKYEIVDFPDACPDCYDLHYTRLKL